MRLNFINSSYFYSVSQLFKSYNIERYSVAGVGVSAGEFVDVASELVVTDDFIKGVAIRVRILRMQPVAVLVDDGVTANLIYVGIQLGHGADELIARHLHVLGAVNAKQLRQIVDDEVEALLSVGAHEDVGLLEGRRGERTLGRLVEERAVNHRHERELADPEGAPFVLHQLLRILCQQTVDRLTQIVAIMRATHCFGQPDATHDRFVARDYRPWCGC
ncbi:hypothetical protein ALC57_05388 [Trachymyrmex cornetzi]|uniref:Uncharacterized protein n=1 Tax=Trachymyrmex cornetzi TaxID=471704 RepID=A0A151JAT1_9HYME|nr:hypothetical protein ALC57_05388 [Trachymyrmex cornetzi]